MVLAVVRAFVHIHTIQADNIKFVIVVCIICIIIICFIHIVQFTCLTHGSSSSIIMVGYWWQRLLVLVLEVEDPSFFRQFLDHWRLASI